MKIEFIPTKECASIKNRFEEPVNRCISIKGAIAFWTFSTKYVKQLSNKLSNSNSFFCIDINQPTDLNALAVFKEQGSNVCLYDWFLSNRNKNIKHLLHTKLTVFDFSDGTAEIWNGSHNYTRRAFEGPNIEASFIIHTNKTSELYNQSVDYLNWIKGHSTEFNIKHIDYYKFLQGTLIIDEVSVLSLVGKNLNHLSKELITVLGHNAKEFGQYKLVGKEIFLQVYDIDQKEEYIYKATIHQAGEVNPANPQSIGVNFSERRFGEMKKNLPAFMYPKKGAIATTDLNNKAYFININVIKVLSDVQLYTHPFRHGENWIDISNSELEERTSLENKRDLFGKKTTKFIKKMSTPVDKIWSVFSLKVLLEDRNLLSKFMDCYQGKQMIDSPLNKELLNLIKRSQILTKRCVIPEQREFFGFKPLKEEHKN